MSLSVLGGWGRDVVDLGGVGRWDDCSACVDAVLAWVQVDIDG